MHTVAIVEFWMLGVSIIITIICFSLYKREHEENANLKLKLERAKASVEYTNALMELKDEANRKSKEKNKKFNEGTTAERVNNALSVLHDD